MLAVPVTRFYDGLSAAGPDGTISLSLEHIELIKYFDRVPESQRQSALHYLEYLASLG